MIHRQHLLGPLVCWLGILLGETVQAQHFEYKEHHLGPTGPFGITLPTDIRITKVQQGSPADGKLKGNDVGRFQKQWDKMVEEIENAPPATREMLTTEEARLYGLRKTT